MLWRGSTGSSPRCSLDGGPATLLEIDMETIDKTFITFVLTLVILVAYLGVLAVDATAQDKVKYCKNAQTGEIIVVQENMPCPFGTHKI